MNDIQELESILRDLLALIQQVLESGETIDDEVQGAVAQTLELLMGRIEQLKAEGEQLPSTPIPQLDEGPFPSSNVNSFNYDPKSKQLYVKFHGKDSANSGPTYLYQNIPGFIYDVFSRGAIGPKTSGQNRYHRWIKNVTPSLGGTLNALIKAGGFQYQKIA